MDGVDGWVDGWMDGWMDVHPCIRSHPLALSLVGAHQLAPRQGLANEIAHVRSLSLSLSLSGLSVNLSALIRMHARTPMG